MSAWLLRLHSQDERMLHAMVTRRWWLGDLLMHGTTHFGDAATTIGLTLLLMVGADPSLQASGRHAAIALVVSHLGVQFLKRIISRARPRLPVGCSSLVQAPDRFSFPSGHAAASLSVALPLASVLPPIAGAAVLILAALVGLSRCYLGVHYPGDVVAGWLLALGGAVLGSVVL